MIELENLVSLKNLSKVEINQILYLAEGLEDVAKGHESLDILKNKVLATFFYEPSTRTRLSFETAMLRLGGWVVSMADAKSMSSVWKGETLGDTIRTIDNYANVIALRHPEAGAAEEAVSYSKVPILNAGDGTNEHPTQALLDLLTIKKQRNGIDGLKIGIAGDLKHTRSTNSLTIGLSNYDVELFLSSPEGFETSDWILDILNNKGVKYHQNHSVKEMVDKIDVLYVCRIQKERLENKSEYENIKGKYFIDKALLEEASQVITILHHLPRIGELAEDVDEYAGAAYFPQTFNGVLIRGALLAIVLGKTRELENYVKNR